MLSGTRLHLLTLLGSVLLLSACDDDFGARCDLPSVVEEACQQQGSKGGGMVSHFNCFMKENLDCSSKICVIYQDSEPFCSKACKTDGDCPGDARCLPFLLDESSDTYCVKRSAIP